MSVMLRKPIRRLASRTLRKAFRAFVVPTVAEKFQVISMRCLWRAENNDVYRASEQISAKRRQLEVLMTENPNILLFITSLTAQGVQEKSQGSVEDGESMSESENDDVDQERKIDSASKRVYPGLTLWIVLDIPITCLSTVETDLMKMILNSGLDVMSCKPIRPRGKQGSLEVYTVSLCQCLKDYNNSYMKELACIPGCFLTVWHERREGFTLQTRIWYKCCQDYNL